MPIDRGTQSLVKKILSNPVLFPDEFKAWLANFLAGNSNLVMTSTQMPPGYVPVTKIARKYFTSSGTYTPDPGVIIVHVELVGGGGGGGGSVNTGVFPPSLGSAGCGGGGGEYVSAYINKVAVAQAHTVTIGAGGGGGNAFGGNGAAGGSSSFQVLSASGEIGSCPAAHGGGGGGGDGANRAGPGYANQLPGAGGGAGSSSSGSNFFTVPGQGGQRGIVLDGDNVQGGAGGDASGPPGGRGAMEGGGGAGATPDPYGAGGEGGSTFKGSGAAGTGSTGGAGRDGICCITEYVAPVAQSGS